MPTLLCRSIRATGARDVGIEGGADLNILAPNTVYPMFVVAPADRKNRVREQLRRPTFRQLGLDRKVRFLSYESIDEIDRFFGPAESGLSVETIVGRSEAVA